MATCGKCGKVGASVAEIRACYGVGGGQAAASAPAPAPRPEITEGLWQLDGQVYRVVESQEGRLYATTPKASGGFAYAPGMMPKLRAAAEPLGVELAAQFGRTTGYCCCCGRKLTNAEPGCSVERGYGPVCAEQRGWPWGPQ